MSAISAQSVKELREKTGVGMMDCKKALTEAGGDIERANEILREKGLATAKKKSGRAASQGLVGSYIHMDKIGVLLEVNCETDFVAKTDDFRTLVKDVSMQIAASSPAFLSPEDVPDDVIEKEKEIFRAQIEGKPENVMDKIIEGKLKKFYEENCLTEQIFVKDPDGKMKIKDLVTEKVAKLGENIVIRRFARFAIGEAQD